MFATFHFNAGNATATRASPEGPLKDRDSSRISGKSPWCIGLRVVVLQGL